MQASIPRDKLDGFRAHLEGLPVKVAVLREQRGVRPGRVRVEVMVALDARRSDTRAEGRDAMGAVMRALDWAADGGVHGDADRSLRAPSRASGSRAGRDWTGGC